MNRKDMKLLRLTGACGESIAWMKEAKITSLKEAWNKCQRSDWMLWGLDHIGYNDERTLRLYACKCVRETPIADGRKVWDLLTDERSRKAVEVAELFAEGKATKEELGAAWDAARDAAWAAARAAGAAAWAFQSDLLRSMISWETVEERMEKTKEESV
jgi:hypothetical protein